MRGWRTKVPLAGVLALALSFSLSQASALAQTYEAGLQAFNRAYYEEAEAQWLPLAESGDLRSQYALGVLYEKRAATDPSLFLKAAEWYRRAAAQGHPGAQTNYAKLLATGQGVSRDQALAVHYWGLAARQDNALAQYNLGLSYYRGEGVIPDAREALAWFRRAADSGMADSQFAMGQMNALGVGTARNPGRALTWFTLAEKQGHVDAGRQAERLREEGVAAEEPGPQPPIPSESTDEPTAVAAAEPEPAPVEAEPEAKPESQPQPQLQPQPQQAETPESPMQPEPAPEAADPPQPVQQAAASVMAAPETGGSGGGSLWLGSFSSRQEAEIFRDKTLNLYGEIFADKPLAIEAVNGSRFRVSASGLADRAAAKRFCGEIMQRIDNAFCAVISR